MFIVSLSNFIIEWVFFMTNFDYALAYEPPPLCFNFWELAVYSASLPNHPPPLLPPLPPKDIIIIKYTLVIFWPEALRGQPGNLLGLWVLPQAFHLSTRQGFCQPHPNVNISKTTAIHLAVFNSIQLNYSRSDLDFFLQLFLITKTFHCVLQHLLDYPGLKCNHGSYVIRCTKVA